MEQFGGVLPWSMKNPPQSVDVSDAVPAKPPVGHGGHTPAAHETVSAGTTSRKPRSKHDASGVPVGGGHRR
jgi:hypothetical protein